MNHDLNTNKKILLGHLASFGDCLYATTIAKQIKIDYPGCHLTWAIGSKYSSILDHNPDVDEVWEIPLEKIQDIKPVWENFEKEVCKRQAKGDFDEVFLTQFSPCHLYNFDGLIRSSTFRGYPKTITVPVNPVLKLSNSEIENVKNFIDLHKINEYDYVILFECSPQSEQSFITPNLAIEISEKILNFFSNACIILSSNLKIKSQNQNIIDGSLLSFRENAELSKYCSLLIGCSSGITWICTSNWAKPLPMLQLLKQDPIYIASVVRDHECWRLPTNHIIEMTECEADYIVQCVSSIFLEGIDVAKSKFHKNIQLSFNSYSVILGEFIKKKEFNKARILFINHLKRHGLLAITSILSLKWNKLIAKINNKCKL
jgi:hypothetical protein